MSSIFCHNSIRVAILVTASTLLVANSPPTIGRPVTEQQRAASGAQAAQTDTFQKLAPAFLKRHCLTCHTGSEGQGGLDLQQLTQPMNASDSEIWEQVFAAVEEQYMPPLDHPTRPNDEELQQLKKSYLEFVTSNESNSSAHSTNDQSNQPSVRRLSRTEYENTVSDLLCMKSNPFENTQRIVLNDEYFRPQSGVMTDFVMVFSQYEWKHRKPSEFPGLPSPPGDAAVEHGFDNSAVGLSFSPLQLESYYEVANTLLNHPSFPLESRLWEQLFQSEASTTIGQVAAAEQALKQFLPRAFRRPITEQELDRWIALFERQIQAGDSYAAAMKSVVTGILISPSFLFHGVASDATTDQEDYAIASKLSYFLWSSMPDDELLRAADAGQLKNPVQLRKQIRRMMQDRRSKALSTSFGVQWLKLLKSIAAKPDRDLFRAYYRSNGMSPPGISMAIEQMLLFESIYVENRSIFDFIDAEFGYLNAQLLNWYGIDAQAALGFQPEIVDMENFFRVRWPNRIRGGIISSGSTLLSTSATDRTSPVYRGAWVLETIFNRPPPPPPANVSSLVETPNGKPVNIRERLSLHRQDANCATCHNKIDPLGFALEQFDPVGQLRDRYPDGTPIDTSGEFAGQPLRGIVDLKDQVLQRSPDKVNRFARGLVEHLFEYSVGRAPGLQDEAIIELVLQQAAHDDYRFQTVIELVALASVGQIENAADPQAVENNRMTSRDRKRK